MMSNVHRLPARLAVNSGLLQALVEQSVATCALGFIQEHRQVLPMIGLSLPALDDLRELGTEFGLCHRIAKCRGAHALQLGFDFVGTAALQVVLDAANPSARRVLGAIATADAYFVLVVSADGSVATFRAIATDDERRWFAAACRRPRSARIAERFAQLENALLHESNGRRPLLWVGRDDPALLELSGPMRFELPRAAATRPHPRETLDHREAADDHRFPP
jgi:hypothetical protein